MAAALPPPGGRGRLSIGEVLSQLREDFPDVSISKIRFLEAEGLIAPQRTSSGYRKFSTGDVDRLRYILSAQRDHYYPLRVIKVHLDALERGLQPPAAAGELPRAPQAAPLGGEPGSGGSPAGLGGELRLSRQELAANSDLDEEQLAQLVSFGIVKPRAGTDYFDSDALLVCRTAAQMAAFGLEPRHLRPFKTAADRQLGLIDQVVSPLASQRDEAARARASEIRAELGTLCVSLHAALVGAGVRNSR